MPARPILNLFKSSKYILKASLKFSTPRWKIVKSNLVGRNVLDFGLGMGSFAKCMLDDGYHVVGLDVDNTSLWKEIQPVIYDGKIIPFKNNVFDNTTVICVLHHCQKQEQLLNEIMRVSKRAIVIEDTYRNQLEHIAIAIRDSIENWEFYKHTYRSYPEWKKLCENNGWKVKHVKSWSSWDFGVLYGHQTCFVIEQ
ncbi:hypothetical protein COW38_02755 [Candidatus Collierbacteria bacterium CG17_big_fil_post_rev_8_21_14_2_50_45_7]|uniref:Methyltransferase type 11 domain-containing protein n=1 Tax=Candidatus Collierbacteria bacterium CG17_big_fil_post_rev_8_21_14_2_50_45_7 TaxID=1974536 RepID=A0A2M7FP06_9BACT|nr:MAG: hypothetical protein COW38_02755 [Candidatus Collierbacteria bacterium CG17_big_fil_post_rev_8_21_14_2_50_45_7]